MKNTKLIAMLIAVTTISALSAGDVVTNTLDTVSGGRYSDTPADRKERVNSQRKLQDKRMSAEDKKAKANKQYQDKQEQIRRKKEDRKLKNQMKE